MDVLSEIHAFLDERSSGYSSVGRKRNTELISYYYGFGDSELPTLEEVAEKFGSIGTRERVRQIINHYFRDLVAPGDIPSIQMFSEILSSRAYWISSELHEAVAEHEIASRSFSVPGLLRLLRELRSDFQYEERTFTMEGASRYDIRGGSEYLIIRKQDLNSFRRIIRGAASFVGTKGLARFEDLASSNGEITIDREQGAKILRLHPNVWMRDRGDGLWYMFENRDNTLVNSGRKALTAFERCDVTRLAVSSDSALRRRVNRFRRPPIDLIEDYLRTSRHFVSIGNTLYRADAFKAINLPPIDKDTVAYLQKGGTRFTDASAFLQGRGHSKDNIQFALTMSPLVYVDRSAGRQSFTYHTVGAYARDNPEDSLTERYLVFRNRLAELRDTDSASDRSARREQHILSEWLFAGKQSETCSLCGREFSVSALVTAHKKRRADCNEGERRDPNIVMPLCVFGCDFMYENNYVYVENGAIERGKTVPSSSVEQAHVDLLVGRVLETRWQLGLSSYFHNPAV